MGSRRVGSKNKTSYYQITALHAKSDDGSPDEGTLVAGNEFEIEGELDDHVIISVPPSMSQRSVETMLKGLSEELTSPAIVVTHNIHFLKAKKLSNKEAMKLAKRLEVSGDAPAESDPMGRGPVKVWQS